ncbi:MAG: class I SAM-dependent methyltransferase [Chloroflexota bacterium]
MTLGEQQGYWAPGDLVGDPMAGAGVSLSAFRVRGYDVVGIERRREVYELLVANAARQDALRFGEYGKCVLYHADCRNVVLDAQWDACFTQPPYRAKSFSDRGEESDEELVELMHSGLWTAIASVFRMVYAALKPGGVFVTVTRNRSYLLRLVDVAANTQYLAIRAGFAPLRVHAGEQPNRIRTSGLLKRPLEGFNDGLFLERGRLDLVIDGEDILFFRKE